MAKKPIEVSDLTDLRLIELGAENFKRIKAVRIRPKGPVTTISGRNGQGKSSVLESFLSLFQGATGVSVKTIHKGADEASSYAILGRNGEPLVTVSQRIWEKKGGGKAREIIVEGADGTEFKSPQTIASALYAPIAFDPFGFLRLDAKQQVETLKALVPGFDFAATAAARETTFRQRTDIGRDLDRAKARATMPAADKVAAIDVSALAASLAEHHRTNSAIDKRAERRADASADLANRRDQIELLEAKLAQMKREADELEALLAAAEPLPAKVDTAAIEAKIARAEETNKVAAQWAAYEAARVEVQDLNAAYEELTGKIGALDQSKIDAIAAAKLPVKGLAFDEDGVTLNGFAFADASSAEQLRASTLLAMAMNPDLRVIVIREGSLLDDDSLELLTAMAVEHNFDLLIERVTNGEKVGIVIEDGEVAS